MKSKEYLQEHHAAIVAGMHIPEESTRDNAIRGGEVE